MLSSLSRRTPATRLRQIAVAALALVALSAAACGDDDDDASTVTGTYELTGVSTGSSSIFVDPATFPEFQTQSGGTYYGFKSGSLVLNTDGTFTMSVTGTTRPVNSSTKTDISFASSAGTWSQSGSTITFDPTAAGVANFTGTLQGGGEMRVPITLSAPASGSFTLRFEQP